jgi:hypothetical protein
MTLVQSQGYVWLYVLFSLAKATVWQMLPGAVTPLIECCVVLCCGCSACLLAVPSPPCACLGVF